MQPPSGSSLEPSDPDESSTQAEANPEPAPPLFMEPSSQGLAAQGLDSSPFSGQQSPSHQAYPAQSAPIEPPLPAGSEGFGSHGYPPVEALPQGYPPQQQGYPPQQYPQYNPQFVPPPGYAPPPLPHPGGQPHAGYPQGGYPPPYGQGYAPYPPQNDATSGLIPYKNPSALTAYYLAVFALIPCFGLLLAPPAFILGMMGLKYARANPQAKGTVHAWIGIIGGGLITLCYIALFLIGSLGGRH